MYGGQIVVFVYVFNGIKILGEKKTKVRIILGIYSTLCSDVQIRRILCSEINSGYV